MTATGVREEGPIEHDNAVRRTGLSGQLIGAHDRTCTSRLDTFTRTAKRPRRRKSDP